MDNGYNGNALRVLVIDTDPGIRRLLRSALSHAEYRSVEATDLEQGRVMLADTRPELVLACAESFAQLEAVARLKQACRVPVIVLSTLKNLTVPALATGADDFIEKPFRVHELLARVRVALRHAAQIAPGKTTLQMGSIKLDLERRLVTRNDVPIRLTRREYEVLSYLALHSGRIVASEQILRDVWGPGKAKQMSNVRECICLLRQKLEPDPPHPRYILTEPFVGYRLLADQAVS